ERREVRREETADRAAADDADPHHETAAAAAVAVAAPRSPHEASLALTRRYIAVLSGAATPTRSASRTSAPVMNSTSVGRCASTSSSIDGRWAQSLWLVSPRATASTF